MRVAAAFVLIALGACAAAPSRPLQFVSGDGPVYPASAEAAGIEGFVMVGYDVSDTGEVINVSVIDAQPPGVFDAAAIAAVAQWRFNAAVRHGVTVAATGRSSRIEFKLGDNEAHVR